MADEVETDGLRYNGKALEALELLPGKNDRQRAILGHLINDQKFFAMARRRIKKDWFVSPKHSKIYQYLCLQVEEIGGHPNVVEFKNYLGFIKEGNDEKIALWREIDEARKWAGIIRLEVLRKELTDWMHSKIFQESMLKAAKAWNANNWQEVGRLLEEAAKEYRETTFDQPVEATFDNTAEFLTKTQQGNAEAITTGCYLLDRALLDREENKVKPESGATKLNSKGLQKGDTTVILAPVNTGKTTTLITMANFAMRHGSRVLFMTHEGRPDDIKLKFLKALLNKSQTRSTTSF
jgi:replicative DNA helicase